MRFCMITTFYPPYSFGGDATYVRALSRSLVAQGHEVDVIASTDAYLGPNDKSVTQPDMDEGVRVHRLRHKLGSAALLLTHQTGQPGLYGAELKRLLSRPYDVIHFHNTSLVGGPGVLSMGEASVRLYSLHEHWLICPMHIFWKDNARACDKPTCFSCAIKSRRPPQLWRYTGLRDRQLARIDRLLSPSEYTAQRHRDMGVKAPIHVLPLFSSLDPDTAARDLPRPEKPTVLFVGRVTPSKGIAELCRVMAEIPEVDLLVIGDGDLRADLIARHAGHPNIRFLGHMPQADLVRHYVQAAALVFPSIAPETFGLAVVEAGACGTPAIVAKGAGGGVEIVTTSGAGIVYGGPEELAAAVRKLAFDPVLRDELGGRARAQFERLYARERHIAGYLAHVEELMHAKAAA